MATNQRAKELAHQVEYLTKVVDEMSEENTRLIKMYREAWKQSDDVNLKNIRLRKYITDKIEKGN